MTRWWRPCRAERRRRTTRSTNVSTKTRSAGTFHRSDRVPCGRVERPWRCPIESRGANVASRPSFERVVLKEGRPALMVAPSTGRSSCPGDDTDNKTRLFCLGHRSIPCSIVFHWRLKSFLLLVFVKSLLSSWPNLCGLNRSTSS